MRVPNHTLQTVQIYACKIATVATECLTEQTKVKIEIKRSLFQKQAVACEGQKLYIECSQIYDRIQVQTSFYGREDAVTCKHPELPSDKICTEQNDTVKNIVEDLCEGEAKCEVTATNDFLAEFGTIICPNVYKYLYVKYRLV